MALLSNLLMPGLGAIQIAKKLKEKEEGAGGGVLDFMQPDVPAPAPRAGFFDDPDSWLFGDNFFNRSLLGGSGPARNGRPEWSILNRGTQDAEEAVKKKAGEELKKKEETLNEIGGGHAGGQPYGDFSHVGPGGAVGDPLGLSAGNFGIDRVNIANIGDLFGLLSNVPGKVGLIGRVLGGLLGTGSGYSKSAADRSAAEAQRLGLATPAPWGTQAQFDSWGGVGPQNAAEEGAFRSGLGWAKESENPYSAAEQAAAAARLAALEQGVAPAVAATASDAPVGVDFGTWSGGIGPQNAAEQGVIDAGLGWAMGDPTDSGTASIGPANDYDSWGFDLSDYGGDWGGDAGGTPSDPGSVGYSGNDGYGFGDASDWGGFDSGDGADAGDSGADSGGDWGGSDGDWGGGPDGFGGW